METVLAFLGFTMFTGGVWNAIAYSAACAAIYATVYERGRYPVFAVAGFTLALYSYFFLHNTLFTTLQLALTVSALFQVCNIKPRTAKVLFGVVVAVALAFLFMGENITTLLDVFGILGLLGIAAGIISLPKPGAFFTMALSGGVLVVYAFLTGAWVFVALNFFFALANLWKWKKAADARYEEWLSDYGDFK